MRIRSRRKTARRHLTALLILLAPTLACGLPLGQNGDEAEDTSIRLAPGFAPQPLLASGTTEGTHVNALDFGDHCRGMLLTEPQHTIVVGSDLPNLSIAARSLLGDTTLVVRTPSGQYLCNDDMEGLDPRIDAAFPAGTYEVFVGSYGSSPRGAYQLGVAEQPFQPSSLPAAH